MYSKNPALFIHLPQGVLRSEVERAIDDKDFGELESVSIQKDRNGHRNAIVRFSRWFRSADRVLNSLSRGAITIATRDFGDWKASIYVEPKRTTSTTKSLPQISKKTQPRRPRSPVLTEESEIPQVILEFIETCRVGDKMPEQKYVEIEQQVFYAPLPLDSYTPIAPALPSTFVQDPDAMEGLEYGADLEDGQIWEYGVAPASFERYRNPGYYY
jgi:hypothetical protein